MAWIESHQSLAQHPKTRKLARKLDVSVPAAMGHLHALWHWSLDHAFDGDLTGYDPEDIAIGAMWDGDPDDFLKALIEAKGRSGFGFVEQDERGTRLHNWLSYTAHLRARRESAQKANHVRWHVNQGVNDPACEWCRTPDEEQVDSDEPPDDSERTPNGYPPESTEPNLTEPTEPEPLEPSSLALQDDTPFDAFWQAYPRRNGKKLHRGKAEAQWQRLKPDQRVAAVRGALHYAAAVEQDITIAADAFRWLRDGAFTDWQEPAEYESRSRDRIAEMGRSLHERVRRVREGAWDGTPGDVTHQAGRSLPQGPRN